MLVAMVVRNGDELAMVRGPERFLWFYCDQMPQEKVSHLFQQEKQTKDEKDIQE